MINTLSGGFFILTGLYSGGLIERVIFGGGGVGGWGVVVGRGVDGDGSRLDL